MVFGTKDTCRATCRLTEGTRNPRTRFIKMATAEATAVFVLKFNRFTNRAYNKKAIMEVEVNSRKGNVVSSLYEDENVRQRKQRDMLSRFEHPIQCYPTART